jgi:hypothetical protein
MSFVKKVIGFALGGGALGGESCVNEKQSTGIRVSQRAKATSEMGIQVGTAVSKTMRQEQMRYQRMSDAWRRLRDTAATQNEASSTVSRLTDQAEDYHIGKVISKLLKPEKEKTCIVEEHTCCVCLDAVCDKNMDMTRTSCGHVFHLSCLLKSLKMKNACPMCRSELENSRPSHPANVLTPVSSEQMIEEEISYFPIAAHTQSIATSRHPKRRVKELLRIFGFTLLRTVAEYIHDENMPPGWFDDGDSTDDSEDDGEDHEEGESDIATESGDEEEQDYDIDVDDGEQSVEEDEIGAEHVVTFFNSAAVVTDESINGVDNGFSDPDPDPYDDIYEQIRDTRGSNRNLRVINSWRHPMSNRPAPPPNEDLRESLNQMSDDADNLYARYT